MSRSFLDACGTRLGALFYPEATRRSGLITLTTDFGTQDTYVGVMKGVLLGIAPEARLIDLTHAISPQNVLEASARLEAAIDYFPPGTVHLAVVDPGVGSARKAIVVQTPTSLFVGPDNGLFTLPLKRHPAQRVIELTDRADAYALPGRSATFHGRDLFAPIAAHLALGIDPAILGVERDPASLVALSLVEPEWTQTAEGDRELVCQVLYADRFGNLITDLTQERFATLPDNAAATGMEIQAGTSTWNGMARTYAEVAPGEPLAYWGSGGRLEIGIRDGDAAQALNLRSGDRILLRIACPSR